jgi:RimJ/RimL family protein N-acetyltransferase
MNHIVKPNLGQPIPNWTPRPRPTKTKLIGKYCNLEQLDLNRHGALLYQALQENGDDSWAYLPYGPYKTFTEFTEGMHDIMQDPDTLLYAIVNNSTRHPIGVAGYLRINPDHGSIEVGHLHYSKYLQKTQAATEAMYLLMHYALEELGYRRYEWKCNSLNLPSRRSAERLGFQYEGTFRQSNIYKGHNRDTMWFSIIDSEWPVIKAKLEKWLDPNNFTASGEQILKLQEI